MEDETRLKNCGDADADTGKGQEQRQKHGQEQMTTPHLSHADPDGAALLLPLLAT